MNRPSWLDVLLVAMMLIMSVTLLIVEMRLQIRINDVSRNHSIRLDIQSDTMNSIITRMNRLEGK